MASQIGDDQGQYFLYIADGDLSILMKLHQLFDTKRLLLVSFELTWGEVERRKMRKLFVSQVVVAQSFGVSYIAKSGGHNVTPSI